MSSSDTDCEDLSLFRDAIDREFIERISVKAGTEDKKVIPSLRPLTLGTAENELKVTPEFQNYVAKNLEVIIKRKIKEVCRIATVNSHDSNEHDGIRMFSNSKKLVRSRDLDPEIVFRKPIRRREKKQQFCHFGKLSRGDENVNERQRLKEAAVSPEWVLKKEGAYGRCSEKGRIIRLMNIGDGNLIEILEKSQNKINL